MIRLIVATACTGYLPTLVSPDSITASAPSMTAFATSEASARVGREWRDHRLEHLGRDDHRLGVVAADLDGPLLHHRHLLERHLDAEVAAGHHHAVEGEHDLLEPLDGLRLLDLGDHRAADADLVHHPVHELDVLGVADEGQRDEVDAQSQRELQILGVLLRHRRHADRDAGQRQTLVVADRAAFGDVADDVGAVLDLDGDERDVAVVDEQPVAGPHVVGELLVRRRDAVVVAGAVLDGDADPLAGGPHRPARRRSGRAGSWALQVGEHRDVAACGLRGLADLVESPAVLGVLAVAEVQPGHVHAGLDERPQPFWRVGGRAEGADDLRAAASRLTA